MYKTELDLKIFLLKNDELDKTLVDRWLWSKRYYSHTTFTTQLDEKYICMHVVPWYTVYTIYTSWRQATLVFRILLTGFHRQWFFWLLNREEVCWTLPRWRSNQYKSMLTLSRVYFLDPDELDRVSRGSKMLAGATGWRSVNQVVSQVDWRVVEEYAKKTDSISKLKWHDQFFMNFMDIYVHIYIYMFIYSTD